MPKKVDLRDSDGDGTTNNYEMTEIERYTADIAPIENVKLEMRIKLANSISTELRINMSNQIDVTKLSREFLVKNPKHLPIDEYFSEWSKLKIDSEKIPVLPEQISFRVDLFFSQMNSHPDKLILVSPSGRKELGDWSQMISLLLSKNELEDILKGESFLTLSRRIKQYQGLDESQEESIKNKTYRVFLNDGVTTKIYYVAKDFSFSDFLKAKKITRYQPISTQNLLRGRYLITTPEWWLNEINGKDKVIIKDDLNSLSKFYLQGLEKSRLSVVRTNGFLVKSAVLTNDGEALILLKLRVTKQLKNFKLRSEKSSFSEGGGGRNPNGGGESPKSCINYYRDVISEEKFNLTEQELRNSMVVTSNGEQVSLSASDIEIESGRDELGFFFDIALRTVNTTLELKLKDLDQSSFMEVGLYQTTCQGTKLRKNLLNSESFMDLAIEAYVDKL